MRHNDGNPSFSFVVPPEEFTKQTPREELQFCLGGTQYVPGNRDLREIVLGRPELKIKSIVACLEDAVADHELPHAQETVLRGLSQISQAIASGIFPEANLPLIFVRVRSVDHFTDLAGRFEENQLDALTGFVFPKFQSSNASRYFSVLRQFSESTGRHFYAMPIMEGESVAFAETRQSELLALRTALNEQRDFVLNVRIGGTDFSSFFGVRRSMTASVYDILPVSDILSDIINVFGRRTDGFVLSGAVWEYFLATKTQDLAQVASNRLTDSILNREPLINPAVDGLLRELLLDKANGLVGKTVIHPSHLRFVNAMQAVTLEEYEDAEQILGLLGGVSKSPSGNKMNESSPHRSWAQRIIAKGRAYGVIESEADYLKLFEEF